MLGKRDSSVKWSANEQIIRSYLWSLMHPVAISSNVYLCAFLPVLFKYDSCEYGSIPTTFLAFNLVVISPEPHAKSRTLFNGGFHMFKTCSKQVWMSFSWNYFWLF